ncbi:methyl-accepting chemotaxis protein [Butyrivibrio fibrisolvens DSM 3071]|uniref:Methyl-accepting chemotaxis protein n=1 Tax=Butyrivibrio fibrisolvens DSM 3071 TaxID=1121131 RepID=A0A1M5UVW6_BUTFI|nr:methyl-accepting chemotaxis protein [Butyrivibrio fibrisolvens]SHH67167.1 methyl-accepting chemotaxis protein [Butyrivibrio fibrisolvens DSM 3071]
MAKENNKSSGNGIGFLDSIKTKLILIMILIAAVPLAVAVTVSYNTSTSKALADAADSAEWEVWYFEGRFETICTTNMNMIQSIAGNPVVVQYITGDTSVSYEEVQDIIRECDEVLNDGDQTSIAGPDGFQIVRTSGDFIDVSDRAYFQEAMKGNSYISDLTVSKTSGKRMISFSTPVYDDNNNIIAVVHRNYNINNFHEILASETDSAFMIDRSGKLCAHAAYEIGEGAHDEVDMSNLDVFNNDESEGFYLEPNYDNNYIAFARDPNTGFIVCTSKTEEDVLGAARQSAVIVICVGIALLITAIIISLIMAKSFTEPIEAVAKSLESLSDGRFNKVEKHDKRKDEFGLISKATNSLIETLDTIVTNIKKSAGDVGSSSDELSDMADQISKTAEDVSHAVQEIASGANQQADEIQSATENVGKIGDAVGSVQSSSNDLTSLASKMKEASEISSKSLESLQTSSTEMTAKIDDISNTIQATKDAVNNISEKVEGITSIATQTNLLSLNASIEAARAGEAGKGFAVVAEEIGKLAEDSKQMADDIRKEMETLLAQSEAAVNAAAEVKNGNTDQQIALGETLDAVNGMLEDISSTVDGVHLISEGADTCESSKDSVVDTMSALSAISEENAASSQETGASMQELSETVTTLAGSANDLKDIAQKLNEEMKFFKSAN